MLFQNYAGDDEDEDVEMGTASDEEADLDDEDYGDDFTDDDDTSWKVRRSSAKLLNACISTRSHDLLGSFYQSVSPVLIQRFGEREETVKVEVWTTFTSLLAQTKVWGVGSQRAKEESTGKLKRKRSSDMMDTEEG